MNNYEDELMGWASKYNGYDRIGQCTELGMLLGQLERERRETNAIPAWIGVDLLRGWAFYLVRSWRWDGHMVSIFESYPEFEMITEAIRNHPAAKARDLPPARPPMNAVGL